MAGVAEVGDEPSRSFEMTERFDMGRYNQLGPCRPSSGMVSVIDAGNFKF